MWSHFRSSQMKTDSCIAHTTQSVLSPDHVALTICTVAVWLCIRCGAFGLISPNEPVILAQQLYKVFLQEQTGCLINTQM